MSRRCRYVLGALMLGTVVGVPLVQAQVPVIDIASLTQLIQQVQSLLQQIALAEQQLAQMQTLYQSTFGQRGMQNLLNNVNRNYLPTDWPTLLGALQGTGSAYPALTGSVQSQISANAVLTPAQIGAFTPTQQAQLLAARQQVAGLEGLAQQALADASQRFSDMQSLIDAIGSAPDQKSVLELEARVAAELGMLQAEQTKLQVLHLALDSLGAGDTLQQREQAVSAQGRFASRFEPAP